MGMPFEEAGYTARISNAKQLQDTFRQFESARPKPQLIVAVLPLKSDVYGEARGRSKKGGPGSERARGEKGDWQKTRILLSAAQNQLPSGLV